MNQIFLRLPCPLLPLRWYWRTRQRPAIKSIQPDQHSSHLARPRCSIPSYDLLPSPVMLITVENDEMARTRARLARHRYPPSRHSPSRDCL